jgi:hypothetical protein
MLVVRDQCDCLRLLATVGVADNVKGGTTKTPLFGVVA